MRSRLTLIDIITSSIRALKDGLSVMYDFRLSEFPKIIQETVFVPRVVASDYDFVALIRLSHSTSMSTGFVLIYLPKKFARQLIESTGLEDLAESDIEDACGELCNLVAGTFKNELSNMVSGDIKIDVPKLYTSGSFDMITGVNVDEKYIMKVKKKGIELLEMHLAFQSVK